MTTTWRLDSDNLPVLAADPAWIAYADDMRWRFPDAHGDPLVTAHMIIGDSMDSLHVTWESEDEAFPNFRLNMGGGVPHEVFAVILRVARRVSPS